MNQARPEALAPEDFAAMVNRLVLTRWVASALVVGLTFLCVRGFGIPLPTGPLLGLAACLASYNTILKVLEALLERASGPERERRVQWYRWMVVAQVALDWLAITVFVHLTGGVTSPAIVLFLIHMVMVTALLQSRTPYLYPALAIASMCVVAVLEGSGVILHYDVLPWAAGSHRDLRLVAGPLAFFAIAAFASVHMTDMVVVRLRERERQLSALLLASQAASSSLDIDEVLGHLVESAMRALSAKAAHLRLVAKTSDHVNPMASIGLSTSYLDHGIVDLAKSRIDCDALSGVPVVIANVQSDPRVMRKHEAAAEGIASMLAVPVLGQRGVLGVLHVYAGTANFFVPAHVAFALSVASQGAAAIENALIHEQLQRADKSRSQFVRTVTHELRSPIAGSLSLAQALFDGLVGELGPSQKSMVARMSVRLAALAELVNDLLALAASQSPELQEEPRQVNLLSSLRRVAEQQGAESTSKGVALHLDAPESPIIVTATDQGLARIFDNLVGNAKKYTPGGGRIEVRAHADGPSAVVSVADSGIGIPEEDLPRLFEDFFRARNTRSSAIAGTGLGLSIVKRLVAHFRGVVTVASQLGHGTTFTVVLPLADATESKTEPRRESGGESNPG
jgi:signal transduction histidine kinase